MWKIFFELVFLSKNSLVKVARKGKEGADQLCF